MQNLEEIIGGIKPIDQKAKDVLRMKNHCVMAFVPSRSMSIHDTGDNIVWLLRIKSYELVP